MKVFLNRVFSELNPVNKDLETAEKIINYSGVIFTLISFVTLYQSVISVKYFFEQSFEDLDFNLILSLILIFYLPVSMFLFWKKQNLGWFMTFGYLLYSGLTYFFLFITIMQTYRTSKTVLDMLGVSPFNFLFKFLFFTSLVFLLSKQSVRIKFKIETKQFNFTIGLLLLITIVQYFYSYLK